MVSGNRIHFWLLLDRIPYSGKFSWMAPFANFVSRRCPAILWCEGIESSVLLVAKMAVNEDVYVIQSKIRGYHVYKNVWEASIGEQRSEQRS